MITIDTISSGFANNATTVTIPNFTTTKANEIILLFISGTNGTSQVAVSSITSGGLVWSKISNQAQRNTGSYTSSCECWAAFASLAQTNITITITMAASATTSVSAASYYNVRSTGGSAWSCITNIFSNGVSSTNTLSFSMPGRSKNGLIIWGLAASNGTTVTAGTGQQQIIGTGAGSGNSTQITIIAQNTTSNRGDTITNSASVNTSQALAYCAIELIDPGAGMVFAGRAGIYDTFGTVSSASIGIGSAPGGTFDTTDLINEIPVGSQLIIFASNTNNSNTITSITDARGNTYVGGTIQASGGKNISLWACENVGFKLFSGDTITINYSGSGGIVAIAFLCHGLNTSGILDQFHSAVGNSTSPNSGTVTLPAKNEIILGINTTYASNSFATPASNYIPTSNNATTGLASVNTPARSRDGGSNFVSMDTFFTYSSLSGSATFSETINSNSWICGIFSLVEATTGITTTSITTTNNSATITGNVSSPTGIANTGVLTSTNPNDQTPVISDPNATNTVITPDGSGNFDVFLSDLIPGTTYYYGIYITDNSGLTTYSYGSFTVNAAIKKKRFYYKVYDTNLRYVTTWSADVISDPTFRMVVNGGAGQLMVKLGRKYNNFGEGFDVVVGYRVELWVMDCDAPNGRKIYTGYISAYAPTIDDEDQYVDITVLGFATNLTAHVLIDPPTGDTTITYTNFDPSTVIMDAIDKYHDDGGNYVFYTPTSIAPTNSQMTYTFINVTIQDTINQAIQFTPFNWYWYVDANGIINMQSANIAYPDHKITIGKDISYMQPNKRLEGIINAVNVVGGNLGVTSLYNYYERSASITLYGKFETSIQDYRIIDDDTSDMIAKRKLDQFQDPEYRTVLHVVDNNGENQLQGVDIESFYPGQTIQVINLAQAPIIIIQSITYYPDHLEIEASTRLPEIAIDLNSLETQLVTLGQGALPAMPTVRSV